LGKNLGRRPPLAEQVGGVSVGKIVGADRTTAIRVDRVVFRIALCKLVIPGNEREGRVRRDLTFRGPAERLT
jgi:hypothetical protein